MYIATDHWFHRDGQIFLTTNTTKTILTTCTCSHVHAMIQCVQYTSCHFVFPSEHKQSCVKMHEEEMEKAFALQK